MIDEILEKLDVKMPYYLVGDLPVNIGFQGDVPEELTEYSFILAFDDDRLLLIDVDKNEVRELENDDVFKVSSVLGLYTVQILADDFEMEFMFKDKLSDFQLKSAQKFKEIHADKLGNKASLNNLSDEQLETMLTDLRRKQKPLMICLIIIVVLSIFALIGDLMFGIVMLVLASFAPLPLVMNTMKIRSIEKELNEKK